MTEKEFREQVIKKAQGCDLPSAIITAAWEVLNDWSNKEICNDCNCYGTTVHIK